MNHWRIKQAASALRRGGVIGYPTEAVWGLGCDPYQRDAVERLLALKQRPVNKGLILVAASMDQLGPLLQRLTPAQQAQLESTWPGPTTWLIPDPDGRVPRWIKGDHGSVAVRVSSHLQTAALCRSFGGLLVSTSANLAGADAARSAEQVRQSFGRRLDYVLPGALSGRAQPSTIRDLCSGATLRRG